MSKQFLTILIILSSYFNCIAQWSQTNGPEGARIFDQQWIDSDIWAATDGGLFISSNEGQSWNLVDFLPLQSEVRSIFQDGEEIILTVAEVDLSYPSIVNAYDFYFYRSVDGGANWMSYDLPVGNITLFEFSERIKIYRIGTTVFFDHGYNFNQNQQDLFRSDNNGATWQRVIMPSNSNYQIACDGARILIANSQTSYLSNNKGETWELLDNIGTYKEVFLEGNRIFVDSQDDQLYISEDLGENWTITQSPGGFSTGARWVRGNSGKLYQLNRFVYVSEDNGYSWDTLNNLVPNRSRLADLSELSNGELLVGMEDGIFKLADNNAVWSASGTNMIGSSVFGSLKLPNGDIILTTNLGYFRTTDRGESWYSIQKPPHFLDLEEAITIREDSIFIHGFGRKILCSTDNLNTVDTVGEIPHEVYNTTFRYVKNRFYLLGTDSYQSEDLINWDTLIIGDINVPLYRINDLIATEDGSLLALLLTGEIYRSTDDGITWNLVFEFTPPGVRRFYFLEIGNRIFYYDWNAWYYSTDNGLTWNSPAMNGLPEIQSGNLPILAANDESNIFVTIFGYGVYKSIDFGENWSVYNTGLENFRSYEIFYLNDYLYLGSLASGIWRREVAGEMVGVLNEENKIKNNLEIFPNPAKENIYISLGNEIEGDGVLDFFDTHGRLIRQQNIQMDRMPQKLNTEGLSSGFYHIVLLLNGQKYNGKLILR